MASEIVNDSSSIVRFLKDTGYHFIYPDCDFMPLNVARAQEENGPAKVIGPLTDLVSNTAQQIPSIRTDLPCPTMVFSTDSPRDVSFGLTTGNMVVKALQCLLKADIKISDNLVNSADITFGDPTKDAVWESTLLNYLNTGAPVNADAASAMCGNKGFCLAIYEVLKSKKITITFKKDEKAVGKANIEPILNLLTVKSQSTFSANDDGSISYINNRPITFAFKGINFHIKKHLISQPSIESTILYKRGPASNHHEEQPMKKETSYETVVDSDVQFDAYKFL